MLLTVESMVAIFGEEELLQLAGTGPRDYRELDRAKIEEAIGHATALIAGYVTDRWPSALPAGTPMLRGFCADLARWRLRGRGGQQSVMNDTVKARYDEAIARLKDIQTGRLNLDVTPQPSAAGASGAAANELRVTGAMPPARTGSILAGFGG